jgi:hypothetical protein
MAGRSPFPGMDPWLESQWGDLHHRIVQYSCDLIADQLPQGLFASVEETVYVMTPEKTIGRVRPDAAVFETKRSGPPATAGDGGTAVAEPVRISITEQHVVEGHIEIRKVGGNDALVTAIEVISPTNKSDIRGRKAYSEKREAYYAAGANVVEIDLLRAGEPLIDVPWERLHADQLTAYRVAVRRGPVPETYTEVEYYPLPLRQRLPRIAIPLRVTDRDVVLDLQAPIDLAYQKGRYGIRIDYSKPPVPPLSSDDARWAAQSVAAQSGV